MSGSVLVIPLDSALVWAEAYAVIAVLVALGFMIQRIGWSDTKDQFSPTVWAVRVIASGIVVGALWPLWVAIALLILLVGMVSA